MISRLPDDDPNRQSGSIGQASEVPGALGAYDLLMREHEAVIDSTTDGLWICDGEANVLRVNRASERLHAVRATQVIGRNMRQLVAEGIFDRSATLEVIRTRSPVHMLRQQHGRKLVLTGLPIFDREGKLVRVVVNEHDITELDDLRRRVNERCDEVEPLSPAEGG